MLLAADIGNTSITLGLFKRDKLQRRGSISTHAASYRAQLLSFLKNRTVSHAIICSVVPEATRKLSVELRRCLNCTPVVVGRDVRVPMINRYRDPKQVGQDRLVNAYAGSVLYGYPLIIIDFGTAVTLDVISRRKEYLGGMILPGLNISLESLATKTALLPHITLSKPKDFIGRDTKTSMLSGLVYGLAASADTLATKTKKVIGESAQVIGTGGNIEFIRQFCSTLDEVDHNLTLKGLALLYNLSKKS